jgi:hypothetical protein
MMISSLLLSLAASGMKVGLEWELRQEPGLEVQLKGQGREHKWAQWEHGCHHLHLAMERHHHCDHEKIVRWTSVCHGDQDDGLVR